MIQVQTKPLPLPDSEVYYLSDWLNKSEANHFQRQLTDELAWHQGEVVVYGKRHKIPRLQAWHGDEGVHYRYSGVQLTIEPWTPGLTKLRKKLATMHIRSNAVLANLYRGGEDKMGWHSDNEKELGPRPVIASVSLGEERDFVLKHRITGEKHTINLAHGSLLIMAGETQRFWLHSVPVRKRIRSARLNLTFRHIFG